MVHPRFHEGTEIPPCKTSVAPCVWRAHHATPTFTERLTADYTRCTCVHHKQPASRAGIRATADHCPPRRAATSRQPILTLDGSDRIGFHTAKWVEKSYSCTNQIQVGESRFFVFVFLDALESKVAYLSIYRTGRNSDSAFW